MWGIRWPVGTTRGRWASCRRGSPVTPTVWTTWSGYVGSGYWRLGDGRFQCRGCRERTSVTAGTIFDRTRTPLTVWFTAVWLFAADKGGISALSVQRELELGSYQTAWAMLHRLRSVLVRPGRDRLTGTVEVDETYIGGVEPGLAGGRARGKEVLAGIAVEVGAPRGLGRCRIAPLPNASAKSLRAFLGDHVEPGSMVITDGWVGYRGLPDVGYGHDPRNQHAARDAGQDLDELLPGVHRVASLLKRWLLGTHQGGVDPAHLPAYGYPHTVECQWPSTDEKSTPNGSYPRVTRRPIEIPPR